MEHSCGTIPFTVQNGQPTYLLLRSRGNGDCGFPKGHVETVITESGPLRETDEQTALRETWEETSLHVSLLPEFRRETTYTMPNGRTKRVTYFLAHFENQTPRRNPGFEVMEYLLRPFEEALVTLTFENTRVFLREADAYLRAAGYYPATAPTHRA
jgi:8-oxo-dGTP pyrophosphatase MutT (NUDIX family)